MAVAMFRRRSSRVDLAVRRAELEALEAESAEAEGKPDPRIAIELKKLALREKQINHRIALELEAAKSDRALKVLRTITGKSAPENDDPMQYLVLQMLSRQMQRDPIEEALRMRDLFDYGAESDDEKGAGWRNFGEGIAAAATAVTTAIAQAKGMPMQRPANPRLLPPQLQPTITEESEEHIPMPEGLPTAQQALVILTSRSPQEAAAWLIQQPAFRERMHELAATPDTAIIPRLQTIQRPAWFDVKAQGERAVVNLAGYMPIIDYLVANPTVTMAIVTETRKLVATMPEQDAEYEDLEMMPEVDG